VPGFPKLTGGTMNGTSPSIAMDTLTIATDQGTIWQLTPAPDSLAMRSRSTPVARWQRMTAM
jgi:hypothetical protein